MIRNRLPNRLRESMTCIEILNSGAVEIKLRFKDRASTPECFFKSVLPGDTLMKPNSQLDGALDSKSLETSVTHVLDLEMTARTTAALRRNNIHTLAVLMSYNKNSLKKLRGIGPWVFEEILHVLYMRNIQLKE
jgi:DNA-directed RNA polymerase alpha subunit